MRARSLSLMTLCLVIWPMVAFGEPETSDESASAEVSAQPETKAPAKAAKKPATKAVPSKKKKNEKDTAKAIPADGEAMEATPLDGEAIEAAPLDGEAIEAAPLDGEAIEAAPLDGEALDGKPDSTGAPKAPQSDEIPAVRKAESASEEAPGVRPSVTSTSRQFDTLDTITIMGDAENISRVSGSAHLVDKDALEAQEYDDVHRVLKQVHPETRISKKGMTIINNFVEDTFEKIASENPDFPTFLRFPDNA